MKPIGLLLALSVLAGCGEEPQVLEEAQIPGYRTDGWIDQLRERGAAQSENERIYQ